MKFEKLIGLTNLALVVFCLLFGGNISHATLTGLPSTDTSYATWDTFSGITFSNASPTYSNGMFFNATLTAANGGGSISGGGDRYYSGSGASTASVDFTINGTATAQIDAFTLYLKYTNPAESLSSWANYFTVTFNGLSATQTELGGTGEFVNSQQEGIVQLTWSGVNLQPSDSFIVSITKAAQGPGSTGHVSVDAVQIVPEPSTYALLVLGLGIVMVLRFRPKGKMKSVRI